ncbi:MAG: SPOR domain-containing protein [Dokdonella sp.]|uniref:SPOR domain-containing protein n=1 Tax=Dokdonella sp. TaxID=2291710 RepID=UPI0025C56975|nr:SPOR domain-containing protein [Dokdonella sp.]MBX3700118.1 SPOR domain-containing protein [Dokdonella sp.]
MAAKKGRQATRGGGGSPGWAWLIGGIVIGAALMALLMTNNWLPLLRKKDGPQPNAQATAPKESEPPVAEAKPKKNYDFYQVLPEAEVVIPDAELSAKAQAEQQARAANAAGAPPAPTLPAGAAPSPSAGGRYILQTASYPDPKGAEEAKARLALVGFSAQVLPVTINGKTWHRVRVGPYATASELESAKRALADNGINAIALKEQGGQ